MAFGTWIDGNQLGATDVNTKIAQVLFVDKPSDESVTSSTVIQNDNHLKFTAEANSSYWIKMHLIINGADAGGGIQPGYYAPAGATFDWVSDQFGDNPDFAGPVGRLRQLISYVPDSETNGPTNNLILPHRGILKTGPTAGVFGFRWAQSPPGSATATKIVALSCMAVVKLV